MDIDCECTLFKNQYHQFNLWFLLRIQEKADCGGLARFFSSPLLDGHCFGRRVHKAAIVLKVVLDEIPDRDCQQQGEQLGDPVEFLLIHGRRVWR